MSASVLVPDFNPLTHRLSDEVEPVDLGGGTWHRFKIVALTYAEQLAAVQAARREAYPPVGDQLDAAFKARAGDPSALAAVDAAIAAVKATYPKPEA